MKLALALVVAIAVGACTRIVVLSGPTDAEIPDADRGPDAKQFQDAHIPDGVGNDGGIGDAALPD